MALHVAWIAVKGLTQDTLLDRFGLEAAGDASDELSVPLACAELPSGWTVLVTASDHFSPDEALPKVGEKAHAIGGEFDEHVMFSRASCSKNGRRVWTVTHDPDATPESVISEGELPPEFTTLKARMEREQAAAADQEVDHLFELPVELAKGVTGYRPLESTGVEWSAVQAKAAKPARAATRRKTLRTAMKSELLPLLASLGWTTTGPGPRLSEPGQIFRLQDGLSQSIWFEYADNAEVYIEVQFYVVDRSGDTPKVVASGRIAERPLKLSWWQALIQFDRAANYPRPEDRVGPAIERARADILIADAFLRTREPNRKIRLDWPTEEPWLGAAG